MLCILIVLINSEYFTMRMDAPYLCVSRHIAFGINTYGNGGFR